MKDNGGPAFPIVVDADRNHSGMTLRDYFAAKAMQGMLSVDCNGFQLASKIIELSYEIADAMIKERNK